MILFKNSMPAIRFNAFAAGFGLSVSVGRSLSPAFVGFPVVVLGYVKTPPGTFPESNNG